jgi:hypothetical protein
VRSGGERCGARGDAPGAIVRRCWRWAGWGFWGGEMWDRGVRGDAAPSADSLLFVLAEGARLWYTPWRGRRGSQLVLGARRVSLHGVVK